MRKRTPHAYHKWPVSPRIARQFAEMTEKAALNWDGYAAALMLVKDDPEFERRLFQLWAERAAGLIDPSALSNLEPWATLEVGTHNDKEALCQATFYGTGHHIFGHVVELVQDNRFTVEKERRKIDLFTCIVAELGFLKGATVGKVWSQLGDLKFTPCPRETALQLCRQHPFRLNKDGEATIVLSKPLRNAQGDPFFLQLDRNIHCDDSRVSVSVNSREANGGWVLGGDARLVFCHE